MFDEPETLMTDLFFGIVLPGMVIYLTGWVSFRLIFNDALLSMGLEPIRPAYGFETIASGAGRLFLLIGLTTVLMLPYIVLYARFFRPPLEKRGLV